MLDSERILWEAPDILLDFDENIDVSALESLRGGSLLRLGRDHWQRLREYFSVLPFGTDLAARGDKVDFHTSRGVVTIGRAGQLDEHEQRALRDAVSALIPWRKGPFSLFGIEIDSEWRSDFKWDRLSTFYSDICGKKVLDIGCSNGYYMLRMLEHEPEFVLGLDPSETFYFSFQLMQRFLQDQRLRYELLGIENLGLFKGLFDVVFCMGILYHQRNPLACLKSIRESMAPGGLLIVENQAIYGEQPLALFAPDRYAKARNVFFVPTASCLSSWLSRSGFKDVQIHSLEKVSFEEQRKTEYAPFESLSDFLDPDDEGLTIEGLPAPWRVIVSGRKE